ncbi:MAG: TIGR03032 family protein [Planctomycetes bacterium]|nr:TIGR03032 family protein [Planctomycetota bacterium]
MSTPDPSDAPHPAESPFCYVHSPEFPALLERLRLSLAVTTYQAGKLMVVRASSGTLSTLLRSFESPMGLAVGADLERIVVGTRRAIWTLRSEPEIAPQLEPRGRHDACFVPRRAHVTGNIHGHEIALVGDRIWIVNTAFSCLCTLDDERYGFMPQWKPPFVDRLAGEDRCHLNGLAVEDGRIAWVTALGETNHAEGWRENKTSGGIVMNVATGAVVARGLCMPHSPRVHDRTLFVLDSGRGRLCTVDPRDGRITTVAALPGYARGLAVHGETAFVGLSKVREKDLANGLPVTEQYRVDERRCGIAAIDLRSGRLVAFLWFEGSVTEIFDIRTLPGLRWPAVVGFQDQTLDGIMTAPKSAWQPHPRLPADEPR